jgi:hypothetical protein
VNKSDQILEELLAEGRITQEDIDNAKKSLYSEDEQLAITIHSLICDNHHISLEESIAGLMGCSFYAEEKSNEPWSFPTHKKWLEAAKAVREKFDNMEDIIGACSCVRFYNIPGIKEFIANIRKILEEN